MGMKDLGAGVHHFLHWSWNGRRCLYIMPVYKRTEGMHARVGLGVDHAAKLGSCHLAHCPNLPAPGCLLVSDRM